jgi:hypothetical protein
MICYEQSANLTGKTPMCTAQLVDEVTKKKIAAYSANFREVTRSPFGSEDQVGMLNLIDAGFASGNRCLR